MITISHLHHVSIICSDYERSKSFYTKVLGFTIIHETYRAERQSYKLDLALNGTYFLELFSFPDAPARISYLEATGLRHLAFEVEDLNSALKILNNYKIKVEPLRIDELNNKRFTFVFDPDNLPIELYEA